MKRAVVVGSGAGGAMAARELTRGFEVTIVEAGPEFQRFQRDLGLAERLRSSGLLIDPRMIRLLFPAMHVTMAADHMALVFGMATGGTTTLATANAMRCDQTLLESGIDLGPEFDALCAELPISTEHSHRWRPITREFFSACKKLGLSPTITPKLIDEKRCIRCGRCVLGCPTGAKWDSRRLLEQAESRGARLLTRTRVEEVLIDDAGGAGRRAAGVVVQRGSRREAIDAELVVLAGGGLGTPAILMRSGMQTEDRLFVDPVLCVAAPVANSRQDEEVPMPFVVEGDGYIISPYFDHLSFFFQRAWRRPRHDIAALMIKLADTEHGTVTRRGIKKSLSDRDRHRLAMARETCEEILAHLGVRRDSMFLGMLNAGHPGGMLPLTGRERQPLHGEHLPENLYVADSSLLPRSLGKPPILTIMALARRAAALCLERFA